MQKIKPENYSDYIRYIEPVACGKVYPLSIAQSIQAGDIYVSSSKENRSVLYWHYCGFAFMFGECDERFLEEVYDFMSGKSNCSKRLILFVDNESTEQFFRAKNNVVIEKRYFFEYRDNFPVTSKTLPSGFELCEINEELLKKINGKITPSFSWDNGESFLQKGKGYCITDGDNVAAWAFSAAVSNDEIDIGIETNIRYRNHGFAYIASQKMTEYSLNQHKTPVWACHSANAASYNLAVKLGFTKTAECCTVRIENG